MANTFLISDTHFGHEKTCTTFKRADGSPLRPFANGDEMNEEMVSRWNAVVRPHDKVYHLGDVVINRKFLPILDRLNGKKRLVRGNHDIFPTKDYLKYFEEIYGVRVLDDMILSHIPLARDCITERFNVNVHGHLHANKMTHIVDRGYVDNDDIYNQGKWVSNMVEEVDPRYICVCVENINYTPISIDDVRKMFK